MRRPGLYRQLANILRTQIESGTLLPGAQLPSEARLHAQYGYARETIRHAIGILRAEGLLEVRQGHGTFVRVPEESKPVALCSGDRVLTRMPTDAEQREMCLGEGVPLLVVLHADGTEEHYSGDTTLLGA